jgi:SynChlorMet cassette protein ScmD
MANGVDMLLANPVVVLREEFEDSAVLFDPDTGDGFELNQVGVFVWKLLDGKTSLEDIKKKVTENYKNVDKDAALDIEQFLQDLLEEGLAGYEV